MAKAHIPIDPPAEIFEGLGELAARWGWIENQVAVLIRELLRIKRAEGRMVVGTQGIQVKTQILIALGKYLAKDQDVAEAIAELGSEIQDFDRFRNDVVHGLWVVMEPERKRVALLRSKSHEQRIEPHPDLDVVGQFERKLKELRSIQIEAQRITDVLKGRKGKNPK